jgi:group II intron reverse transcriptase/maturase
MKGHTTVTEMKKKRNVEWKEIMKKEDELEPNTQLCEELISTLNLGKAIKNVVSNKGAAGIDGMTIDEVNEYFMQNIDEIRKKILTRKYKPLPARRVTIPKDNGKNRLLGIPTVIDRVIQQAIVQVLTPVFEPTFSDFSYGFRPKRSAEDAIRQAQIYIADGYKYVVDIDLSKYFDTINHDKLIGMIDKTLTDKDIRRLIFDYLKSGIMENNKVIKSKEGTMQGGPLSPILANIYLTPFDKKLESKQIRFTRFADDTKIFVKSMMAAERVKDNAIKFLENKLKLTVNKDKTYVGLAKESSYLGVTFVSYGYLRNGKLGHCVPKEKAIEKLKTKVKEITKRNRGVSLWKVIEELNSSITGWIAYFARTKINRWLTNEFLPWVRRRVRQYAYKLWKTKTNRKKQLRKLKVEEYKIQRQKGLSSRSYWKMSKIMGTLITNKIMHEEMKLKDFKQQYLKLHTKRMEKDREELYYLHLVKEHEKEEYWKLYEYDCCGY